MPKISKAEVFKVDIPFKISFKHSLKSRRNSESIFVKISMDDGTVGFGESLPRSYVTGNTREDVYLGLKKIMPLLVGVELSEEIEAVKTIKSIPDVDKEARCAIEIALMDCLGKIIKKPVHKILGHTVNEKFPSSAVISGGSLLKTIATTIYFKSKGYRFFKVKVGDKGDITRLGLVRKLSGSSDIRIDANGAWDVVAALKAIENMRKFNISSIEQPTPKGDIGAMQEVSDFCKEPVMADESICTENDAIRLARTKACDMFNVRLSKCGGIFNSMNIIRIALDNNMGYQIGCHVGESGVLTAASIHLAAISKNMAYYEGGYSRLLLKEDIIEEDLTPRCGLGYTLNGYGLGVTVKEEVLRRYITE